MLSLTHPYFFYMSCQTGHFDHIAGASARIGYCAGNCDFWQSLATAMGLERGRRLVPTRGWGVVCGIQNPPENGETTRITSRRTIFSCIMMFYDVLCIIMLYSTTKEDDRLILFRFLCGHRNSSAPHSQVLPSSSAPSTEPSSSSRSELLVSSSIEHFCPGSQMQYFHAFSLTDTRCRK